MGFPMPVPANVQAGKFSVTKILNSPYHHAYQYHHQQLSILHEIYLSDCIASKTT